MSLEKLVRTPRARDLERKTSIAGAIGQSALYSPLAFGSAAVFGSAVTLTAGIPMIGYTIGSWIENKRKGLKMTWGKVRKELNTGFIMGHVDYAMFSTPEILFAALPAVFAAGTIPSMLAASLVFNPIITLPVNMAYETFYYLRDEIGWKKIATRPHKIFSYVKEAYQNKVKKDIWTDTKNVFKYMFPLHFLQMHYLKNATMRMAQSALINNPIYRMVVDRKKDKKPKMYKLPQRKYEKEYRLAA